MKYYIRISRCNPFETTSSEVSNPSQVASFALQCSDWSNSTSCASPNLALPRCNVVLSLTDDIYPRTHNTHVRTLTRRVKIHGSEGCGRTFGRGDGSCCS